MITWFNSREPRERILLMLLGVLLLLFLTWFALSRERGPNGHDALEAAQTDRELWLRAAPKLSAGAVAGERSAFTRRTLIDSARKRSVDLSRVQPQSGGGLTVWVEDIGTGALFGLISDLVTQYAVEVETAVISTAPNGGLNAQLTLNPI